MINHCCFYLFISGLTSNLQNSITEIEAAVQYK